MKNQNLEKCKKEADIMQLLVDSNALNVVAIKGHWIFNDEFRIVMEMVGSQDKDNSLNYWISHFPEDKKMQIMTDVVTGMMYLHKVDVIHCDFKPENILVSNKFEIKIADFGLSRMDGVNPLSIVGSPKYWAPEVLKATTDVITDKSSMRNKATDIYSAGIILAQIESRTPKIFTTIYNLNDLRYEVVINKKRVSLSSSCPMHISAAIDMCWQENPEHRLSAEQLLMKLNQKIEEKTEISTDIKTKEAAVTYFDNENTLFSQKQKEFCQPPCAEDVAELTL